jgi:hypothetical protein
MRDETGALHLLLGDERIPLGYTRDNHALARLLNRVCGASTISSPSQIAVQRLATVADSQASAMRFRRFSAFLRDRNALFLPVRGGKLLMIEAGKVTEGVANGSNDANLWLEHPTGCPMEYQHPSDPTTGLGHFKRLLVETQACRIPEMKWLVAMHEGLFPFVRDVSPARLIAVHLGPSQSGKTSGAQRFTILHGLGNVKGDYSVAALGNMPEIGLLVLDNKEQSNFTRELIDFLLFLATGAERGRSNQDGTIRAQNAGRPVGVITTIEGVVRAELQNRCMNIEYEVPGNARLKRAPIEEEISERRMEILSALVPVLRRYLAIRRENIATPNPIPEFEEHFTALCYLLRAYADVAGEAPDWAENIISVWGKTLDRTDSDDGGELEETLLYVLTSGTNLSPEVHPHKHGGVSGTLYVTEATRSSAHCEALIPLWLCPPIPRVSPSACAAIGLPVAHSWTKSPHPVLRRSNEPRQNARLDFSSPLDAVTEGDGECSLSVIAEVAENSHVGVWMTMMTMK